MKRIDLLPPGANYYKANLHCHTTVSDGKLTPGEIKRLYGGRGYSVVAFTDHRVYQNHEELNDGSFLALAAMETDLDDTSAKDGSYAFTKTYHMNWYDTDPAFCSEEKARLEQPLPRYRDTEYINGYIRRMRSLGFLACYNHPYWSLQTCEDYRGLRGLWGMEIYNHGCEKDGLYGFHPQAYDEMLRAGRRLFCVASDDNHNPVESDDPLSDSFGGYTMIAASQLTYPAIMQALSQGNFYSAVAPDESGLAPLIEELFIQNGSLHIKTSPVEKIYMKTAGRSCGRAAVKDTTLTTAQFPLTGREGYIRIEAVDQSNRRACTNAYFTDSLI